MGPHEHELHASRLAALIQNLQAGLLVEDETRRIRLVNPEFCEIFGIDAPPESLIGIDCAEAAGALALLLADPAGFAVLRPTTFCINLTSSRQISAA